MVKRVVTIPTVSSTRVYSSGGRDVGYVFFRNFVTPSVRGARRRVHGAPRSRCAGTGARPAVQRRRPRRGRAAPREPDRRCENRRPGVRRILSQRQIPIAQPHDPVRAESQCARPGTAHRYHDPRVRLRERARHQRAHALHAGSRDRDAYVREARGQYGIDFCDKTLAPVAFSLRNANGEGDFFGGIPPTCPAPDDLDHQIGDPLEASLGEALTVISSGQCSARQAERARAQRSDFDALRSRGWQSLLNAH